MEDMDMDMSPRKVQPATISSSRVRTIGIHTLGHFHLSVGGRSVQFQRRAQRRVLELLKALIALGRPSVGATRLMDLLWNESEGDRASQCLATTVYRLRELLRAKDAVLYADGQLALNPRYCWVDVWALERLLVTVESTSKAPFPDLEALSRRHHEIAQLYRGDFLDADRSYPWTEAMREQLRARYLRALCAWGQHLQQLERYEEASLVYRQGLEANPLAEECYCQLMHCLIALDRRAEAALLYRRYCSLLEDDLGLQPAPQIRSLYLSLRGGAEEMPGGSPPPMADGRRREMSSFSRKPPYPQIVR
jgi:DNA-binding SARP family transcriptional activator